MNDEHGPHNVSYWEDTSWEELKRVAKAILTKKQFDEWMARPETIERSQRKP